MSVRSLPIWSQAGVQIVERPVERRGDLRAADAGAARRVLRATAACGLCGKESIAAVRKRIPPVSDDTRVPLSIVLGLPGAIRSAQPVFAATGGLHAVGLFRPDGALSLVREDVG